MLAAYDRFSAEQIRARLFVFPNLKKKSFHRKAFLLQSIGHLLQHDNVPTVPCADGPSADSFDLLGLFIGISWYTCVQRKPRKKLITTSIPESTEKQTSCSKHSAFRLDQTSTSSDPSGGRLWSALTSSFAQRGMLLSTRGNICNWMRNTEHSISESWGEISKRVSVGRGLCSVVVASGSAMLRQFEFICVVKAAPYVRTFIEFEVIACVCYCLPSF